MQVTTAALLPLILGLVQVGLQLGLPKKFSPVLAIALGILAGIFYLYPGNYSMGVLIGVSLGLGAVGLHSGVKNVKEGIVGAPNGPAAAAVAATVQSAEVQAPARSGVVKPATAAHPEQPSAAAQPEAPQQPGQGVQQNAASQA